MADSKITALAALTTADPANDMFPVVDVSDTSMAASGTTKRISINNLLACSPSATLASATITGAATVGTTLGVTGASTLASASVTGALGAAGLNVTGATIPANGVYLGSANNLSFSYASTLGMTLNATGLGLGVSPVTALSFPIGSTRVVAQSAVTNHAAGNVGTLKFGISDGGGDYSGLHVVNSHNGTYSSQDLLFFTGEGGVTLSLERMRITRSGDLILQAPSTPPTLTVNGQLTVNATSNTNLRFSYRGSDGTTRVANLTLA